MLWTQSVSNWYMSWFMLWDNVCQYIQQQTMSTFPCSIVLNGLCSLERERERERDDWFVMTGHLPSRYSININNSWAISIRHSSQITWVLVNIACHFRCYNHMMSRDQHIGVMWLTKNTTSIRKSFQIKRISTCSQTLKIFLNNQV